MLPAAGDLIASRFRVEAEIGRGAMGVVFRARDPSNQQVAIKVLLPEAIDTPGATERFTNEAEAARGLTSENTVRVFDAGTLDNALPYMVMELLEGTDMETVLQQRNRLPAAEACDVVIQACAALAEAHGRGMVHRDLKPGNLFASRLPNGLTQIKVLDFGLSKVKAQVRQIALTSTGTLLGTPYYMAPEQLRSSKDVDARADVWSLAVILYELLSGKVPFDGSSFGMLFGKIVTEEPAPLASICPDVPAGLAEIVQQGLKKKREERYPDVTALASALAAFASPTGAALAKRIVEGPEQRPVRPPQGKLGGTVLMASRVPLPPMGSVLPMPPGASVGPGVRATPPSAGRISVPPLGASMSPRPTPVPFTPSAAPRMPTPPGFSMGPAPPPMTGATAHPSAPVPPPQATARATSSRNLIVALSCLAVVLAAIVGVVYVFVSRAPSAP
jgi:serine/threonine-protein kinase